jgi:protein-tyrosine phosphatase
MGNICRSAAAEGVMKRFAEELGVDLEVDSAGTHGYHVGELADPRMRKASLARGYQLTSRARLVTQADLVPGCFDLVLAMDYQNYSALMRLASQERQHIRLFSDYLDERWPRDVPDPYYGEADGFDYVLDMLEEGCPVILSTLGGRELL